MLSSSAGALSLGIPGAGQERREQLEDREIEAQASAEAAQLRAQIDEILAALPNLPSEEVPDGPDDMLVSGGMGPGYNPSTFKIDFPH